MIESIERLEDGNVMIIVADEETSKSLLKRNPRCHIEQCDDKYALVYSQDNINLALAVRPPR